MCYPVQGIVSLSGGSARRWSAPLFRVAIGLHLGRSRKETEVVRSKHRIHHEFMQGHPQTGRVDQSVVWKSESWKGSAVLVSPSKVEIRLIREVRCRACIQCTRMRFGSMTCARGFSDLRQASTTDGGFRSQ
jgi:hypothetical protein